MTKKDYEKIKEYLLSKKIWSKKDFEISKEFCKIDYYKLKTK